jgi:hypothetical protein
MPEEKRTKPNMAQEPDDPDIAADRLEAALERIARLSAVRPASPDLPRPEADLSIQELAERLDSLISRLRTALGKPDTVGNVDVSVKPDGLAKPDAVGKPDGVGEVGESNKVEESGKPEPPG